MGPREGCSLRFTDEPQQGLGGKVEVIAFQRLLHELEDLGHFIAADFGARPQLFDPIEGGPCQENRQSGEAEKSYRSRASLKGKDVFNRCFEIAARQRKDFFAVDANRQVTPPFLRVRF